MISRILILFAILTMSGCGDDNLYDKYMIDHDAGMSVAAKCVVLSERFFLYQEALKHHKQGVEFENQIKINNLSSSESKLNKDFESFSSRISILREMLHNRISNPEEAKKNKEFLADMLVRDCKVKLLQTQFEYAP